MDLSNWKNWPAGPIKDAVQGVWLDGMRTGSLYTAIAFLALGFAVYIIIQHRGK